MPPERPAPRQIAGIDLGSNSFHMVLGQMGPDGDIRIVDRHKEYVRLAEGLDGHNVLSKTAITRALDCLERFAQRLRSVPPELRRCVGTSTLRRARNGHTLIKRGSEVLGCEIAVVSGLEEARLVYKGVMLSNATPGRRMVIDIGGGSTEVCVGDLQGPQNMDSIHLGCVSATRSHFGSGRIKEKTMRRACLDARRKLSEVAGRLDGAFDFALGSSGTINAIGRVLTASYGTNGLVTRKALKALKKDLVASERIGRFDHHEISSGRSEVFAGGVAVLDGVMAALGLRELTPVPTALREGLLVELTGRAGGLDPRPLSVSRCQTRFDVDLDQAQRVTQTALAVFEQVSESWFEHRTRDLERLLSEAAALHEVGLFMGLSGFHKHGAYLISNCDLPGLSVQDQRALAALILCQRGRFSPERLERFRLAKAVDLRLALVLRIAIRLNRTRQHLSLPDIGAHTDGAHTLCLTFPEGWLEAHALTQADLEAERVRCREVSLDLRFA